LTDAQRLAYHQINVSDQLTTPLAAMPMAAWEPLRPW